MPLWLRAFGIRIYSHAVFGIDQEIEKLKDTDKTSEEDREMVEEQSAKYGTGPAGLSRSIPRMLRTAARSQQVCSSLQYLSSTGPSAQTYQWMSRILCRDSVEITARSTDRLDPFPSVPLVASKCADEPTTVAGSALHQGRRCLLMSVAYTVSICRWFKHGFDRVKEASENTLAIVVNKMLPSIEWAVIQVPTKYSDKDKGSKL
jgi:hypothetical protein